MFRTQKAWGGLRWMVCALIMSSPALGARFIVKPLKIEISPRPGDTVDVDVEIKNLHEEKTSTVDILLVDIEQRDNGSVLVIEPNQEPASSIPYSCMDWTSVNISSATIGPRQSSNARVTVRVPRGARGFYYTGLAVHSRPDAPEGTMMALTVRFVVPILVSIQSWGVQQRIDVNDVSLAWKPSTPEHPAATIGMMQVANKGRSFCRIHGHMKVLRELDGHWQHVSRVEFPEKAVLPGESFSLRRNLGRNLPSGPYKLEGTLYVGGRAAPAVIKQINYQGDPEVTNLAVDSSLVLEPLDIIVPILPGSTRTSVLKLENAAPETVHVEVLPHVVSSLKGVSMDTSTGKELTGDELMCHEWIRAVPQRFKLPGGRSAHVNLIVKAPRMDVSQANYYGALYFKATYPDGQSAGGLNALVCVANEKAESQTRAQVEAVDLAWEQASQYVVKAKCGNIGNIHFRPNCKALLSKVKGGVVMEVRLQGESRPLLPLEKREFSGSLDFSKVNEGTYIVNTVLQHGPGQPFVRETPIKVLIKDGQKAVQVLGNAKDTTG